MTNKKSQNIRTRCDSFLNWSDDKLFNRQRARGVATIWGCTMRLAMRKMCNMCVSSSFHPRDTQDKQTPAIPVRLDATAADKHVICSYIWQVLPHIHTVVCFHITATNEWVTPNWAAVVLHEAAKFCFEFHPWHCENESSNIVYDKCSSLLFRLDWKLLNKGKIRCSYTFQVVDFSTTLFGKWESNFHISKWIHL